STRDRHRIRRRPKRKTVQKLKIAWRLCYSRKPFRELCPRMRTPERGQLEAYTIGCQKPPRGFSGQLQTHSHLSSTRFVIPNGSGLCKGGIKKVTVRGVAAVPAGAAHPHGSLLRRSNPCSVAERDRSRSIPDFPP